MGKILITFIFFLFSIHIHSESYELTFACQITDQSIITPNKDGTSTKYTNWKKRAVGDLVYFRLYEDHDTLMLKGGEDPTQMTFFIEGGLSNLTLLPTGNLSGWSSINNELIDLDKIDDSTYRLRYSSHHNLDFDWFNLLESFHGICKNFPVSSFEKIIDKFKNEIFKD